MEKNFRALERIATAAMRWNGATRRGGRWPGKSLRERPDRRFAFRLACALGLTVEDLATRMSAREFLEWQVYDALEGLPARRAEWGTAAADRDARQRAPEEGRQALPTGRLPHA